MKVFISWSGARSKALAFAIRDWLPLVLQYVEPWVSEKDISAGERWAQSIAGELEAANFGIICVTPENISSEWILFEAGALSKSMLDAKVIPLLFGLELSDLSGPLSQFQAQKVGQEGMTEIVRSINKVAEGGTPDNIVDRLVPQLWPTLEKDLDEISGKQPVEKHTRPQREILEELVSGVRGLSSRLRDIDPSESGDRGLRRKGRFMHPHRWIDEFIFLAKEMDDAPFALVLIAGLLRDDLPWLAEILLESYREIRGANSLENLELVHHRLMRSIKILRRSGLMREVAGRSKEMMILTEELPMMLEMTFDHITNRRNILEPIEKGESGE